jgi:hypothetical protein
MIDSMHDLSIATVPSLANNSLKYAAPTSSSSSSSSTTEKKKKKTNKVGWSKGFLNSTTQLKRKTMTTTSDEIYEVDVTAKDSSSIVVQATSSDTLQSMDNNTNTTSTSSIVKTNDLVVDEVGIIEIDKPEVIVASKKNVAFTGHIFERITP